MTCFFDFDPLGLLTSGYEHVVSCENQVSWPEKEPAPLIDIDVKNFSENIQAETRDHLDFENVALFQALMLQLFKIADGDRIIKSVASAWIVDICEPIYSPSFHMVVVNFVGLQK